MPGTGEARGLINVSYYWYSPDGSKSRQSEWVGRTPLYTNNSEDSQDSKISFESQEIFGLYGKEKKQFQNPVSVIFSVYEICQAISTGSVQFNFHIMSACRDPGNVQVHC